MLCTYEFSIIAKHAVSKESFQTVNKIKFERLKAPSITFCAGKAWKNPGPFLSESDYLKNIYTWEELFHPKTLESLRNESLYKIKETYASYYGLCFTMQKLTLEKVSDYSFQIVVNRSMGKQKHARRSEN